MVKFTEIQSKRLSEARTGHLGTADSEGTPHVVPVCFAFNYQVIYSVLDQKPKKAALTRLKRVRNISCNPKVSLVIDHYAEDWERLWYVLVHGDAQVLGAGQEQSAAIKLLREKYLQYQSMDIDQNPVIKIVPSRVISWEGETPPI